MRHLRIFQSPYRLDVLLLMGAALVVRLAAIPWARTVQADAVSRIHIAYEWLLEPHYIKEGYWGPLHHYLNAFFMLLLPGKTAGPLALNILCAMLTVIPLYGFTLNLFGSRKGSVFAVLLYVFSPIILWTSMQALSEVSYGFFLAGALYALSEGSRDQQGYRSAIVGGLLITCAAALRYEAWVIIATLTLVVLLLRSWRYTLVFWLCAMVFPGTWMIGNQLAFGDFLYSVNQNDVWNMLKEGINDEVTREDRFRRAVFFPWSFMLNVSPVVMALLAISLVGAMVRRTLTREQWVWLIPITVMVVVFQQKAWEGSLMMQHRFLVTWLVLLLPYVALVFQGVGRPRLRMALMVLGFVSVIPLTFAWNKVDYMRLLGDNLIGRSMDHMVMAYYREVEVIPRLPGAETDELLTLINNNARSGAGGGLLLDFHGWDRTYYLLLHAEANTAVVGGAKHEVFRPDQVMDLFTAHPHGQLVFSRTGMMKDVAWLRGNVMEFQDTGIPLIVEGPTVLRGLRIYTYRVAAPDAPELAAAEAVEQRRVFPEGRDVEYFDQAIRTDETWFSQVRRQAFQNSVPLDTMVRRNVDYMISLEDGE